MKKRKIFLPADKIIQYFVAGEKYVEMILNNADPSEFTFTITSQGLYTAIACLDPEEINHEKMKKLLFFLNVTPSPVKIPIDHARKKNIRNRAGVV